MPTDAGLWFKVQGSRAADSRAAQALVTCYLYLPWWAVPTLRILAPYQPPGKAAPFRYDVPGLSLLAVSAMACGEDGLYGEVWGMGDFQA